MIGAELLNLMYGNPYNQLAGAMNPAPQPAPNPNPNAPQPGARFANPNTGPPTQTLAGGPMPPAGGPPAPNAPPPPPPGQQGLPPTAATQSPPDLASLYLQMEQRNRSANEIDHGLNMMAAAYSTPSMANAIMGSQRQGQDPGAQLTNLIALQNMQRLNAARPAMIASLQGGQGGQPGMDPAVLNALPTDQLQGLMNKQIDAGIALRQKQAESGIAVGQKGAETQQADLLEAQQKAPAALQQMNDMDSVANQLKGPMNAALTSIVSSPSARMAAEHLLETDPKEAPGPAMMQVYASMLSSDQLAALNQLKKLDAQVYSDAFQSTGSRRTQQEVASLKTGLSPLKNFNQSPDAYMSQFNDFQNQLHTTMANTYGAAGRIDEIPDSMKWDMRDPNAPKPLVDSAYLPKGDKYGGSGGQWASNPPKGGGFDYAAIPSGTVYTAPDGTQRRKP